KYAKLFPASLTAALLKGQAPSWLQPVPMRPGESIRVYRILRPGQGAPRALTPLHSAAKRMATPFMQ
ncbi:MAG: hypothetical protein ABW048_10230, partial [Sphingobium sp.]